MSLIHSSLLIGAGAAAAGGYQIERSIRFNSSDSAYCSRVFTTPTDQKKWTWSGWVKRGRTFANWDYVFVGNNAGDFGFYADKFYFYDSITATNLRLSTAVFRDLSAWYHLQVVYDSANSTVANRLRVYINGNEITTWDTNSNIGANAVTSINSAATHYIGAAVGYAFFSGYLADIYFIDGLALTPSSFTEVSATTGQLIPKAYTGSFGTNGFWLKFSDNSAATATTLGKDYSGNSNNWTPNNLSVLQGNGNYVPQMTSSGSLTFGTTFLNGFDGNITNGIFGPTGGTMTFTPTSAISYSTSVEVITSGDSYSQASLNGGSTISTPNNTWTTLASGSGSITSIVFSDFNGSQPGFSAIRVDGVILVDYRAASANDSLVDTPTSYGTNTGAGGEVRGNYAVINSVSTALTISDGNLKWTGAGSTPKNAQVSIALPSGKWYWEFVTVNNTGGGGNLGCGISTNLTMPSTVEPGNNSYGYELVTSGSSSTMYKNNNSSFASFSTYAAGNVWGIAIDIDAGKMWFSKNGTWVSGGNPSAGTTPDFTGIAAPVIPYVYGYNTSDVGTINFGQQAFTYTAPSGFKALCDTNLPAPVVAKPSTVMEVKLWTGNSSTQNITGLGFNPDLVWVKSRSNGANHFVFDAVRGIYNRICTSLTVAEASEPNTLTAFNSDGFSLGSDAGVGGVNTSGQTYVGWCWDAGSSTVTNTQGSITSSVRANASAGFSIVTYTGNATAGATVGHGLGVAPVLIINKQRSGTNNWWTYHASLGATKYLVLDGTNAVGTANTVWNDTAPTSTVFSIGVTGVTNTNSATYVSYCFAPVSGYSAMGSYVGNGSSDGVFQWCGFRPRWIMWKRSSGAGNDWRIVDTTRGNYNLIDTAYLYPNQSYSENTNANDAMDILSNGFKLRTSAEPSNASGSTYVWAAFAESPFQYARAR